MSQVDVNTEAWIDQYLKRQLSPDENQRFESRMQNDPDFLQEVILRKDIVVGIRVAEDRQLRERLEHIRLSVEKGEPVRPQGRTSSRRLVLWLVAAATAAALAYALFVWA
ncbi:MAG: hypothetical protein KF690_05055 [Bacteroidetes bacterium]|nr:hypothetical protein [Bacteroidota bacterium]